MTPISGSLSGKQSTDPPELLQLHLLQEPGLVLWGFSRGFSASHCKAASSLPSVNLFQFFLDGFSCDLLFLDSTALSVGNPSPSPVPTGPAEKQPFPCKLIIGESCCLLYSFLRQRDAWPQGPPVQSVSFWRLIRVRGREIRGFEDCVTLAAQL